MDFKKLKSGSDVRGVAMGDNTVLTPEVAETLGRAFVAFLAQRLLKKPEQLTIAVGRDSRLSGPQLLQGVVKGITSTGATAADYEMCTTPAMYMAILTEGFQPDASIMITASHHPWYLNGLKFFTKEGGLGFHELDEVLEIAQNLSPVETSGQTGKVLHTPFLPTYQKHLQDLIIEGVDPEVQKPLLGLHVVVDAGNGAGGFYANMLEELGAWVEGSQFLEPDGHFPNHIPNPENAEAMASVSNAVLKVGADLGVIFDADCDRAAIVDHTGREINRNRLIAMISAILLDEMPGATIVTDSVTSSGLADFIQEWGGVHYRYKRGYRNVIDEAIRLNEAGVNCPLAIETSGHAALRSNHFLDDGMYLVTVLLIKAMQLKQQGEDLSKLLDGLKEPVESREIRMNVVAEDFAPAARQLIERLMEYATEHEEWHIAPDNREGVRISFDIENQLNAAWFLLRLSVHDPVMPLNAESDVPGGVRYVLGKLYEAIQGETDVVDLSPLRAALQ